MILSAVGMAEKYRRMYQSGMTNHPRGNLDSRVHDRPVRNRNRHSSKHTPQIHNPMHTHSRFVSMTLPMPAKDHRIYATAARLLARVMGKKAPTVEALLLHDLRGRDAAGVADDYLDSIGWPNPAGRIVALRRQSLSPLRCRMSRLRLPRRPIDPSTN